MWENSTGIFFYEWLYYLIDLIFITFINANIVDYSTYSISKNTLEIKNKTKQEHIYLNPMAWFTRNICLYKMLSLCQFLWSFIVYGNFPFYLQKLTNTMRASFCAIFADQLKKYELLNAITFPSWFVQGYNACCTI